MHWGIRSGEEYRPLSLLSCRPSQTLLLISIHADTETRYFPPRGGVMRFGLNRLSPILLLTSIPTKGNYTQPGALISDQWILPRLNSRCISTRPQTCGHSSFTQLESGQMHHVLIRGRKTKNGRLTTCGAQNRNPAQCIFLRVRAASEQTYWIVTTG